MDTNTIFGEVKLKIKYPILFEKELPESLDWVWALLPHKDLSQFGPYFDCEDHRMSLEDGVSAEVASRASDSWSCTVIRSQNHAHLWTVKGFSQCECRYLETSVKVDGPPSSSDQSMTFRIRLHPQGNKESNKDFTFFQVFCNSSNSSKYKAKFNVTNSRSEDIATTVYSGTQQLHGYFEYIRRDLLVSHILPSDELHLTLNLTITFDTVTKSSQSSIKEPPTNEKTYEIARDMGLLFNDQKNTNFTIKIADGGKSVTAHKAVLSARSSYFAAMLEPHTEEYKTGEVTLEDVQYEVMHELLHFMYSGRSPNVANMAPDLLAAADRFALPGLKQMAMQILRNNFMVESVCQTLVLADMHDARDLKVDCVKFIAQNSPTVVKTEGWQAMVENHSSLVTEVVSAISMEPSCSRMTISTTSLSMLPMNGEPPVKRIRN